MRPRRGPAVLAAIALGAVLATPSAQADAGCEWLAGDLHIHTTYSDDSYGGPGDDSTPPQEFYTLGHPPESQFAVAAARGLDYLAITDHNDVRSQDHFGAAEAIGLIPVPGYEKSLNGHAQMLGATRVYDKTDNTTATVQRLADELRADGGVFQVNHPAEETTGRFDPDDPETYENLNWKYAYEVVPDTVEVWNISHLWQPPMPSGSSNVVAMKYWEGWLDDGYMVGATGGSDNHYLATTAVQGAGQPTTWVCAADRSVEGVLAGLKGGHTFISHQPPAHSGPRVFLEADEDGDGTYEATPGDVVAPGSAFRVRVAGAPGSTLQIISDGGSEIASEEVVSPNHSTEPFGVGDATWVRAEVVEPDGSEQRQACDGMVGNQTTYCRDRLAVLALTSAIYVRDAFDPTTTLVYDGDTTGRVGATATLAATLTNATDGPLAGETVTFTFQDRSYEVVTDDPSGRAVVEVRLTGPPGDYELTARYAGSERYLPSEDATTFTVTTGP